MLNNNEVIEAKLTFLFSRYRMFGNAIDVALRLNTMGKQSKIHISVDTKLLLDSIGGFRTEYRGLFEIQVS